MRKTLSTLLVIGLASASLVGCARPNELLWTPTMTASQRGNQIARAWDLDGKQSQDDIDYALMLRPSSGLSRWHIPQ
jgi:hypothetical protein